MDVGIRELKAHLSEYLARAQRGELIRITERGKPKALLGPVPGRKGIEEGVAEGWLRPGSAESVTTARRFKGRRTITEMIAEDRGE